MIVVSNGTDYLVAWEAGAVFFARVASDGTLLDETAVPVVDSRVDAAAGSKCFSAASNGSDYVLAWCDSRLGFSRAIPKSVRRASTRRARCWTRARYPSRTPPGATSSACRADAVTVASDGKNYVFVWADATTTTLRSVQFGGTGKMAQPTVLFSGKSASLAYGGGEYLLASEHTSGDALRGTRLTIGGAAQSASFPISATGSEPCVASDGSDFFVAWSAGTALKGTRVSATGTVLDPAGLRWPVRRRDPKFGLRRRCSRSTAVRLRIRVVAGSPAPQRRKSSPAASVLPA